MPPKGWKSGRPEGIVKAVRLTQDILDRVARYIERLQADLPDIPINEGIALRRLIRIGLDTIEGQTSPAPLAPTQQPAIPLAAEPAPTTAVQPQPIPTPHAAPGLVHCAVNPDHRPYSASAKGCPMCKNNERARASKQRAKQQAQTSA